MLRASFSSEILIQALFWRVLLITRKLGLVPKKYFKANKLLFNCQYFLQYFTEQMRELLKKAFQMRALI
jgi:hypothetical protein